MSKFSLKNKVAIVTGGGSGIGKAISKVFAEQGASIHILDFNKESGEETIKEIINDNFIAKFHFCDVSNQKKCQQNHWKYQQKRSYRYFSQ